MQFADARDKLVDGLIQNLQDSKGVGLDKESLAKAFETVLNGHSDRLETEKDDGGRFGTLTNISTDSFETAEAIMHEYNKNQIEKHSAGGDEGPISSDAVLSHDDFVYSAETLDGGFMWQGNFGLEGDGIPVEDKMGKHIAVLTGNSELMNIITKDGKVSDEMLNKIGDAKMDSDVWGNVPEDQRQGIQDSVRILLDSDRFNISDKDQKAIGSAFEDKFGSFKDIDLEEFKNAAKSD